MSRKSRGFLAWVRWVRVRVRVRLRVRVRVRLIAMVMIAGHSHDGMIRVRFVL